MQKILTRREKLPAEFWIDPKPPAVKEFDEVRFVLEQGLHLTINAVMCKKKWNANKWYYEVLEAKAASNIINKDPSRKVPKKIFKTMNPKYSNGLCKINYYINNIQDIGAAYDFITNRNHKKYQNIQPLASTKLIKLDDILCPLNCNHKTNPKTRLQKIKHFEDETQRIMNTIEHFLDNGLNNNLEEYLKELQEKNLKQWKTIKLINMINDEVPELLFFNKLSHLRQMMVIITKTIKIKPYYDSSHNKDKIIATKSPIHSYFISIDEELALYTDTLLFMFKSIEFLIEDIEHKKLTNIRSLLHKLKDLRMRSEGNILKYLDSLRKWHKHLTEMDSKSQELKELINLNLYHPPFKLLTNEIFTVYLKPSE